MSNEATQWAWEQSLKSIAEKIVLLYLAEHADNRGVVWVDPASMVEKCSLKGMNVVTDCLDHLEKKQLILRRSLIRSKCKPIIVASPNYMFNPQSV